MHPATPLLDYDRHHGIVELVRMPESKSAATALVGAILRSEQEIRIGDYVFIAHEVVISDCDGVGAAQRQASVHFPAPASCAPRGIWIGDDVWIGMRVTILAGVTIGDGAVIGAGAVVCDDIPPYAIATGNPARVVRSLSSHTGSN